MKIDTSSSQGFSLVEVMVAILVLAVGMLALAKLQGVTLLNSTESRMQTHALNLAQDKIEELRAYANRDDYDIYASAADGTDTLGSNTSFTRSWNITDNPNHKQITVMVEWLDVNGDEREVVLTSNIAEVEPAKSGMVLASVQTVGVSAAQSAEQAAAHAAAAAQYEALVAASDSATDTQKQLAQDALKRANDAADAASDAADSDNADLAAQEAEKAADAMNEIMDIINEIIGDEAMFFTGDIDSEAEEVTVESGQCAFDSGTTYSCYVQTLDPEVSVTAISADDSTSCVVDLTTEPVEGCILTFSENCTAPWGETVDEGSIVEAYKDEEGENCQEQERKCEAGILSGDFQYKSCTLLCKVPDYIDTKSNKIPSNWNDNGPGEIINELEGENGNPEVAKQSLEADSLQDCNTELIVN